MEDIFGERLGPKTGEIEVPEDIFSHIVGYRDVKDHFKEALETESGLQSILLVGPPASSKTLFLRAVESGVSGAVRFSGGDVSKAGIEDDLIRWEPRYVIIDEFHEMDDRDYAPLRLYQDPEATLRIRKGNKDVEFPGDHPVFAAANRVGRKSPETLSRFWLFEFTAYSEDEYVEVCENLLPSRYGVSEDLARFIGREVYRIGDVDVRDAERVAELADSRDRATEKIRLMGKYRGGDNTLF